MNSFRELQLHFWEAFDCSILEKSMDRSTFGEGSLLFLVVFFVLEFELSVQEVSEFNLNI